MPAANPTEPDTRLARLLSFLKEDPGNLTLLQDAAETALLEGALEAASDLVRQLDTAGALKPEALNALSLAAMRGRHFGAAIMLQERLAGLATPDTSARYNLAYALAMEKDFDRALAALDEETVSALPQAATLQIQLLHDRGEFDGAAELARAHIARFPNDAGLAAAVSVLALDVEDVGLARACAETAGAHPDAQTTLGILELGDDDPETAEAHFERALAINPHGPRSWIGRGLARLGQGQAKDAASDIDHGAALFDDHIGSWIAAGWAHLVAGDLPAAKSRFERANEIDRSFAETLGSLAVIDIMEGRIDEARHRTEASLKLDRATFSAALAQTLLLAGDGKPEAAQAIFERALNSPIDASGRTIAQSLARMGLG